MTVKSSEVKVRRALTEMDLEIEIFKPADSPHASNLRPCDFMVWFNEGEAEIDVAKPAWIEVKENPAATRFALSLLRPSQIAGMRRAKAIGLPYFVVVYWRIRPTWTITRGDRVLDLLDLAKHRGEPSIAIANMVAIGGIECSPGQLAPMLRLALLGEL